MLVLLLSACTHPAQVGAAPGPGAAPAPAAVSAGDYPDRLPTQVPLDWDAFPRLPNLTAAPAGRTLFVSSAASGKMDGTATRPFKTIRRALAVSRRGDRISVRAGTYPEGEEGGFIALELPQGTGGVTLVAVGGRARVVPAHAGITYGIDIGASDVAMRGFDLAGFSSAGLILGNPGAVARNLVFADSDIVYEGDGAPNGIAMLPDNGGDDVVDGLLLHNVRVRGASIGVQCNVGPCRNLRFQGLRIEGSPAGDNSGYDGLAVESGDNILVLDTEVTGSSADGIDMKATRVAIFNAFVHHVGRNGIKLWFGGDIVNSVVSHTGADASLSFGTGDYRIVHSVVAYHNWRGSSSYSAVIAYEDPTPSSVELINSVFYRNSGGLYFGPRTKVRVAGCLFADIENGNLLTAVAGGKRVDLTLSDLARMEKLGLGADNLPTTANPRFRSPDRADFRPGRGSALVDAGVAVDGAPAFDLAWRPRVVRKPDIGPFESP